MNIKIEEIRVKNNHSLSEAQSRPETPLSSDVLEKAFLLSAYDRLREALERIKGHEVIDEDEGFDEFDCVDAYGELKEIAEAALAFDSAAANTYSVR